MARVPALAALLCAALLLSPARAPAAPKAALQTVCTITVNSDDEKETLRRRLPATKFRFVELVERGRPDWLASACKAGVRCDVLVVSGHYDGHNEFFSDQLERREYLPVDELERASCSGGCGGVFERLKEVYLFGCNTLNPEPQSGATAEVVRSLVREGHSIKKVEAQMRLLNATHGESSRERMREVFQGVPVIYGFASTAPLGPEAATHLERYLRGGGTREIGQGRASARLLREFSRYSMAAEAGVTARDPHPEVRQQMCAFADDRIGDAARLDFVHRLLRADPAEARLHLDRIQRFTTRLESPERRTPALRKVLDELAADEPTRAAYMALAREAEQGAVRERMLRVARDLGWLSAEELWAEKALMLGELQGRAEVGTAEINLACTLNASRELDGVWPTAAPRTGTDDVPHAAVRACLGSKADHRRMLQAWVSADENEVRTAQDYLRHRPVTDAAELRHVAEDLARMPAGAAQVRALEVLGRHYVADREVLRTLVRLYAQTTSAEVQEAVAGILVRADRRSLRREGLLQTLTQRRLGEPGSGMVEVLLRLLQAG